jgi:nicotinic acid phosphoribosyltransferase
MFWSALFWSVTVAFSGAARKHHEDRQACCCHTGAVRLDSGDLNEQARRVRALLDSGGLAQVDIFCSGNLTRLTMGG